MKIVLIQTAFLGDVILMTSMIESVKKFKPDAKIYVIVRVENVTILANNPHIEQTFAFEKNRNKIRNLFAVAKEIRSLKVDVVFNCHRFASSGVLAALVNAKMVVGFSKNPMAFLYHKRVAHFYKNNWHEVDRNHSLLKAVWSEIPLLKPKLYPSKSDVDFVLPYCQKAFIVIAPASVWATKQYPIEGWIELINSLDTIVYLLGGQSDFLLCQTIAERSKGQAINLAGNLTFLQSAALIGKATDVYANDSAPTHIASAMNAPIHTVFCSTVPFFGFGPLSQESFIHETSEDLKCRPCGIHGRKVCPEGHFNCSKFRIH